MARDTLRKGLQKGRSLAVPGLESSLRQTPLGVEINTATIWLLLHEGRGRRKEKEGRKISTQAVVKPAEKQNPMIRRH